MTAREDRLGLPESLLGPTDAALEERAGLPDRGSGLRQVRGTADSCSGGDRAGDTTRRLDWREVSEVVR